jgi:transposase
VLTLGRTGRIWTCVEPQDGRESFDGLQAVVRDHLARDPLSGDLLVFRNRRRDRLKVLAWQGDGFALYLRRLERGTFAFPAADAAEVSITATELAMILGGIDSRTFGSDVRPVRSRSPVEAALPGRVVRRGRTALQWPGV